MATQLRKNWKSVLSWVLQALLALQFVLAGLEKLVDPENWERRFQGWGYPNSFFYLVASIELLLAVTLLIPKTKQMASIGTVIFMLGAAGTHVRAGDGHHWAAIVSVVLAIGIYMLHSNSTITSTASAPDDA